MAMTWIELDEFPGSSGAAHTKWPVAVSSARQRLQDLEDAAGEEVEAYLERCWRDLQSPATFERIAKHCEECDGLEWSEREDKLSAERLHRNLQALWALLRARVTAHLRQPPACFIARRREVAKMLGVKLPQTNPEIDLTWAADDPREYVSSALRQLREQGWPVDWIREWSGGARQWLIPVLGDAQGGYVADLDLRLLQGTGTLVESPGAETCLRPLGEKLLKAVKEGWKRAGPWSCMWQLRTRPQFNLRPQMAMYGASLGAAAAVGFDSLQQGWPYDRRKALSATISDDE